MNKERYLVIIVIVAAIVLISILVYTVLANHPPAITSLEAEPERVISPGSCQIVCNASDRDGDELSYNWAASIGEINEEGATVNWTTPYASGSYKAIVIVTVTDGRGGEVLSQVTIEVRDNNPPQINSLIADAVWILPSGSLNLTCDASDPDGDELSYEWTATGGDVTGTGAVVIWTAPEEVGVYQVAVVVTDGNGSSATKTLYPSVATGQPPIIEALLVTKDRYGHCYLRAYFWGYKVGMGQKYDIECIVSDTSGGVSYNWSCDGGKISEFSEDGSMITWTAPNTSGYVTVTVIVSDIAGNMAGKNIILNVVVCSACTFGC